jgi:outer membrane protein TolC
MSPGWTAIVSLSMPLISGGGDLGRIRERRALLAAAEASYTNVRRDLLVEIQAALLSAEEAQARLEAAQAKETAAAEGLRLAEGRFQTGLGSALELADAQSQLASAKAERVQSSLDLSVSAARLERLLGRWSPP